VAVAAYQHFKVSYQFRFFFFGKGDCSVDPAVVSVGVPFSDIARGSSGAVRAVDKGCSGLTPLA